MELGRYLVGEAGIYVCRILDKKISRGHTFYVTDGGLHHHLAASGNFGQVLRKNYPVVVGTRLDDPPAGTASSVVGPLCTPLDLLADRMLFPDAEIGDLVVVLQSGAYGYTASPLGFLSHPAPAQIATDNSMMFAMAKPATARQRRRNFPSASFSCAATCGSNGAAR